MSEEERDLNVQGGAEAPQEDGPASASTPETGEERAAEPEEKPAAAEEAPAAEEPEPAEAEAEAEAPEEVPPAGPPPVEERAEEVSDDDRLMAMLAWLSMVILQIPLVSLVLLISEANKNRPFQRFHAVNSILFWVAGFAYEVIALIVYIVLSLITLGCLALFLWPIFFLPHLFALYYAYQAYRGQRNEIPFITDLARGQGWI